MTAFFTPQWKTQKMLRNFSVILTLYVSGNNNGRWNLMLLSVLSWKLRIQIILYHSSTTLVTPSYKKHSATRIWELSYPMIWSGIHRWTKLELLPTVVWAFSEGTSHLAPETPRLKHSTLLLDHTSNTVLPYGIHTHRTRLTTWLTILV